MTCDLAGGNKLVQTIITLRFFAGFKCLSVCVCMSEGCGGKREWRREEGGEGVSSVPVEFAFLRYGLLDRACVMSLSCRLYTLH